MRKVSIIELREGDYFQLTSRNNSIMYSLGRIHQNYGFILVHYNKVGTYKWFKKSGVFDVYVK